MATVRPMKGLLYNPEKVGALSKVMAPPYDVISPEFQQALYDRHDHNVIRLILGKTSDDDSSGSDRYSRAAAEFKSWQSGGELAKDDAEAVYYYTQEYSIGGAPNTVRKGFIARARLEDFGEEGAIKPHEKTLSGPKADRLSLMKSCNANFSSIFSLYSEPENTITKLLAASVTGDPLIEVTGDDGVLNRLWRVTDEAILEKIGVVMEGRDLFIADGHHRYETALNYRNHMRETTGSTSGEEGFDYVMMYFSNMDDEGLDIFPTHRAVHSLADFEKDAFIEKCRKYFDVDEIAFGGEGGGEGGARERLLRSMDECPDGETRFGLLINGADSYYTITLKDKAAMEEIFGDSIPAVYKSLDVTVLHSLILNKVLGITTEDQERQTNLTYIKGNDEAVKAGRGGTNQLVFFMNATRVDQVKDVSKAGLLMPQKSTYFYPKLLSGLVINLLD